MTNTINISAQIPAELGERLEKIAALEERSKTFYIKKALESFLDQRAERLEDVRDAVEAEKRLAESKESDYVDFEDMVKEFNL